MSHRFRPSRLAARLLLTGVAVATGVALATPAQAAGTGFTPPPTGLRVTAVGLTSATVAWDPVVVPGDDMAYTIYLTPGAGRVVETDATTVTFTSLLPGHDYTVHLEARSLPRWIYSDPVTLDLRTADDTVPPSTPTGLRVAGTQGGTATLAWQPSTDNVGVSRYEVSSPDGALLDRRTTVDGDPGDVVPLLAPGTTHTILVTSVDTSGNRSAPASITVTMPDSADHTAPTTPAGFRWTGEVFQWQPASDDVTPTDELGYVIEIDGVPTDYITGGRGFSEGFFDYLYCVVDLPAGTHTFTVRAVDGVGHLSPPSAGVVLTG